MTALVATEYINLDRYATVPRTALVETEKPRFGEGFQYTIYQLLFPLLLEDSNEAAETIARNYGRDLFIKQMNAKAKSIGMTNTIFADPTGEAKENVSTAEDLFMLAKYIHNNRRIYGQSGFGDLENFNDFKDHEYFYGGQKGMTVLKVPVENTFRPITFITLGTASTTEAGQILIEDILENIK
jgi:D-alanyl-D-alanine carboxypeptidase